MLVQALYLALAIAMFVDALRRKPHWAWFLVILLVPYGSLAYLALVALPAWSSMPTLGGGMGSRRRPLGVGKGDEIARLRERLAQLRSTEHLIALAEALLLNREMHEAMGLAEEAHARDATDRRASFVLGAARLALGDCAGGERALRPLVDAEPGYRDHEARLLLCEALWHLGRQEEALADLRDLARRSGALPHRATLAKFLERAGYRREARNELEDALAAYAQAPDHVQKRLRPEARRAEQQLAALRREA